MSWVLFNDLHRATALLADDVEAVLHLGEAAAVGGIDGSGSGGDIG
jgi:hypothetical protein